LEHAGFPEQPNRRRLDLMPPDHSKDFLDAAGEAARSAGTHIRENWGRVKEIHYKSAINLVTSIDRQSEERIVRILQGRFPDHAILAEEKTNIEGRESDYRWVIDPLDGTTNFAHSFPQFSVSIALEYRGEIILGLVYDPMREETFSAFQGQGARLNEVPIHVSSATGLDKSLVATGFPYDRRERADFYLSFFKTFIMSTQGIRRAGSAALDLSYVACGRFDGFWEFGLHSWDTAAGSLLVREAGGTMTDFSGLPFSIQGAETLASNGKIHEAMLRAIQATREQARDVDSARGDC